MGRLESSAWLEHSTLQTEEVEVPELGGSVLIRELPGEFAVSQFIEYTNAGTRHASSRINYEALEQKQFALCVVNEDSTPQFTEDEVAQIFAKHGSAVRRVIEAIDRLSAIDKEGVEQTAARFPGSGGHEAGANGHAVAERDDGPDQPVPVGGEVGDDRG